PIIVSLLLGGAAGFSYNVVATKRRTKSAADDAAQIVAEARSESKKITLDAKSDALKLAEEAKNEEKERRSALNRTEQQLLQRQGTLDQKLEELDRRGEKLRKHEAELDILKDDLRAIRTKQQENLEKIAALSKDEAKDKLLKMTERDIRGDLVKLVEKLQNDAKEEADDRARLIIVSSMERMASDQTAERTITTVPLPSDELKGRVIGKEGRNIQALERATGVDVIIDETPGAIVLSSFDPMRRQVARVALEKLLSDGRIHPARIEEVVAKAKSEVDKMVKEAGEKALKETGVVGVPPELVRLLGQLKFRTSFSQNVLKHSVEMANMAGMIAGDIGADVRISKTATLLHDIGKAVTHEIEGGHHHIGADLAQKYGMEDAIVHAIQAHHDDVEATTPEALVVRVCDALSAGRPGARGDTLENYAKRMTELENLANTFPGVNKSYAISAGRELRIIVEPEKIDDLQAIKMARDIATKVEATLKYPGVIKVNVIRETRAIEYAK
ncbi:MAG TPA: ribonuclease Y, partial [Candidatus Saccharimonadia bacterium]|nr:ribonuclease Y [Candidatus Saccharimonadia bacterium]